MLGVAAEQAGEHDAALHCWGQGTAESSDSSWGQPAGTILPDRLLVGFNSTNHVEKLEVVKGRDYSLLSC